MSVSEDALTKAAETISDALVIDYLRRHDYDKVIKAFKEAKDIQQEADIKGLKLEDVILRHRQSVKRVSSFTLKVKPPKKKPKKEIEIDHEDLNRLIPIKSIFPDRKQQLKIIKKQHNKSELVKVSEYILNQNICVKTSIEKTINLFSKNVEYVRKHYPYIKLGNFSKSKYGDNTEESLILKQWNELIENVPLLKPEKYLKDVENTQHKWLQQMLGAYLSQKLTDHHRCASEIFSLLINLKKHKGDFTQEDIETLLEFNNANPSMQDWKALAKQMGRRIKVLKSKLKNLEQERKHGKDMVKGRFSLSEDCDILKHVNQIIDITSCEELKAIKLRDFTSLSPYMKRKEELIRNRWTQTILPILLEHLLGSNKNWKEEFLTFIVEQKVISVADVDWTEVLKRWPSQTKVTLSQQLKAIHVRSAMPNSPLYHQVIGDEKKREVKTHQSTIDRHKAIIDIYEAFKTRNAMDREDGTSNDEENSRENIEVEIECIEDSSDTD